MPLRFATFNVENLFSRPKAMNLDDMSLGTEIMSTIADLQTELHKTVYDKAKISGLAKAAHGYFKINKTRGKNPLSYSANTKRYSVKVDGKGAWVGFIELKRAKFSDKSVSNTARFLRSLKADVVGICEIENMIAMRQFRSEYLSSMKYRNEMLIDGTDPRGIDVGLFSRFPITGLRTNIHYVPSGSRWPLFPRDCMEVGVQLAGGRTLWVIQCHLKSKLGAGSGNARRKKQATRLAELLKARYDLDRDLVVVSGDMNDVPGSAPLEPLTGLAGLHDVLALRNVPADKRWTYAYRNERNQIDHVLVSTALKSAVVDAWVDRRGMADLDELSNGQEQSMSGVTSSKNAASDHGAVVVDLDLATVSPGNDALA